MGIIARTPETNVPVKFMEGMMTTQAEPNTCDAEMKLVEAHACIAELKELGYRKIVLLEKAMSLLCALADRFGHPSVDQFILSMQQSDPLITQAEDVAKAKQVNEDGRKFENWLDEMLQKVTQGIGIRQPLKQHVSMQTESSVQDAQMQTVEEESAAARSMSPSNMSPRALTGNSTVIIRSKSILRFTKSPPQSEAGSENEDHNDGVSAQHGPSLKLKKMFLSPLSMIKRLGRSFPVSRSGDVRSSAVRPAEEEKGGSQEDQQEAKKPPPALNGTQKAPPQIESQQNKTQALNGTQKAPPQGAEQALHGTQKVPSQIESQRQIPGGDSSQRLGTQSISPGSSVSASAKKESGVPPDFNADTGTASTGTPSTGTPKSGRRSSFSDAASLFLNSGAKPPTEDEVPLADLLKRQRKIRRNSLSQQEGTAPVIPAPT